MVLDGNETSISAGSAHCYLQSKNSIFCMGCDFVAVRRTGSATSCDSEGSGCVPEGEETCFAGGRGSDGISANWIEEN